MRTTLSGRAWLIWLAGVVLLASAAANPLYALLLALAVAQASARPRRRRLLSVGLTALSVCLVNFLLAHHGSHVIASLPDSLPGIGGELTGEALIYGAGSGLRLAAILLAFAAALDRVDLGTALASAPSWLTRSGAAATVALTIYPRVLASARTIRESQRARGAADARLRGLLPLMVPVLVNSLEDSFLLAQSMEARGFGRGPRTRFTSGTRGAPGLGWSWLVPLAGGLAVAAAAIGLPDLAYRVYSGQLLPPASALAVLFLSPAALVIGRRRVGLPAEPAALPEQNPAAPVHARRAPSRPGARVLRLEGIRFAYPAAAPVLKSVDLEVAAGRMVLLRGDSGSGKSTLLKIVAGLVPQMTGGDLRGNIQVAGIDPTRTTGRSLAGRTAHVDQDPERQLVALNVRDEVRFGPANLGLREAEVDRRVEAALHSVAAWHLRDRSTATLSGGELQRVALAGALALEPAILLLDEPTSQLDPWSWPDLIALLNQLAAGGTAIVAAEHRAERFAGATHAEVRLADGRLGWHEESEPRGPQLEPAPGSPLAGQPVVAEHLSVHLGDQMILRDVDLTAPAGAITALVGPNGAGKTTLLRALAGLVARTGGSIATGGTRPLLVPQDPSRLLFRETLAAELQWASRRRSGVRLEDLPVVTDLGLAGLLPRYPRELSTGERQRAALAGVLAAEPEVVLLDEPTRGMDAATRQRLAAHLRGLARRGGTVLVATHDLHLVAAVADLVIRIEAGRTVAAGSGGGVLADLPAVRIAPAAASRAAR